MNRKAFQSFAILTLALICSTSVFPQADVATATVKGTVTDEQQAALPNATVTVKSLDKGTARVTTTNSEGSYHFPQLIPGRYELRVEARGFSAHLATNLELTLGQIAVYDVRLRVGAVTNEVSVTADPPLIETERTGQADTIRSIQVESLPNLNRNYRGYAYTLSDVTNSEAVEPRVCRTARRLDGTRRAGSQDSGSKQLFFTRDHKLRCEFLIEATNLLNHTNFLAVNNVFGTNPTIWSQVGFDPVNGPFDLEGTKNSSRTTPLGFTATGSPRQFQFGLKIAF